MNLHIDAPSVQSRFTKLLLFALLIFSVQGAIHAGGLVAAWGLDVSDETVLPQAVSDIKAISAVYHNLALKDDGTVLAWGQNGWGQADVPAGLSQVKAVAAGQSHSLVLKVDGTVAAWGDNFWGQTNIPPGLSNVVAIGAGGGHNLVLEADGTVLAWGYELSAPRLSCRCNRYLFGGWLRNTGFRPTCLRERRISSPWPAEAAMCWAFGPVALS